MLSANSIRTFSVVPWILAAGGLLAGIAGVTYAVRNRCANIPAEAASVASAKSAIEKISPFASSRTRVAAQPASKAQQAAAVPAPSVEVKPDVAQAQAPPTAAALPPRIVQFNLSKSKHLQQLGPVMVALRKSDVKRQQYNLNMATLDGQTVEKKNLALMEPVYISSTAVSQRPLEFVVNRIEKDRVSGYIRIHDEIRTVALQQQ